ncbi:CDAN1-interacting nuclease 1 [Coccinella septempunctata]|uniref:CDAN1-interacting nuclease 1 n=1 Tax=Coccinella septempunctata TaxID=41139 RepID=UPI001D0892DD|nr:CDAN1-interacting nuclease 1 [Coccinella septempunctata]
MSMKAELFKEIVTFIKEYKGLTFYCLDELEKLYPSVSKDALASILSYEFQSKMRAVYSKSQQARNKYWEAYNKGMKAKEDGVILRISKDEGIAPCLIAKLILLEYLERSKKVEDENVLQTVNRYLKNTSLIPDGDLAVEVFMCTVFDNLYSPAADVIRHATGQQYEIQLHKEVTKLNLAFRDEEYLRRWGYDKTPDIKLEVPISIDGFLVNWIESKGLFGSEKVHREYTESQYLSYWNRFGPGLVIYWFGYVETIIDPNNKSFLIRDHMPTDIITIGNK